jgi:hypothetical protein
MDMRHPSTPGDRPTVRGRARQGQTRTTGAAEPLCTTCGEPLAGPIPAGLGSRQPRFPAITRSPQSFQVRDPRRNRWEKGR